eukprot:4400699-Prymnesium_polylepis.1
MLGVDNAGKTTLSKTLSRKPVDTDPSPTVGFCPTKPGDVKFGATPLTLFDVGGGKQIRGIWNAYYCDVHAAVFVVDAADSSRFPEVRALRPRRAPLREACTTLWS